ncbi:uncharacterized protein LOC107225851 isoform X2 [Neodiprion lecontei]|uniref:Uncharacterized protein LOC107225851 isoform X2 n=1 Tax=Neodiprion lecontei TaxID=441921 RepID=A0ABM3FNJ1_NEOLC|nr:uncharacterized protein LOC124213874 isoform X2 [Neodiprion pinetum]XP_046589568.1 uncharacterized protein LOC107225851 isoform X2 [Neodiprion lecontei]
MRPDSRSISFTFHRSALTANNTSDEPKESRNLRRRLQDRFDQECPYNLANKESPSKKRTSKSRAGSLTPEKGWSNLSLSNVSADSRRAFRNGAEKLSKTISSVRMTFGTISQKFNTQEATFRGMPLPHNLCDTSNSVSSSVGQDTNKTLQSIWHRVAKVCLE